MSKHLERRVLAGLAAVTASVVLAACGGGGLGGDESGGNDGLRGVAVDAIESNLRAIIGRVR